MGLYWEYVFILHHFPKAPHTPLSLETRRNFNQKEFFPIPDWLRWGRPAIIADAYRVRLVASLLMITEGTSHYQKVFEPGAASIQARLDALKQLHEHNIETWLFIGPILPQVTEYELEDFIKSVVCAKVQEIHTDRLRLKPGLWKYMHSRLKRDAPELIKPFKSALWENAEYFVELENRIMKLCQDYGVKSSCAFDSQRSINY